MQSTKEKQRTNITLTASNFVAARELRLNVPATSDAAVADAVLAEAWAVESAAAISERNTWIEANGTPLKDLQVLKVTDGTVLNM